MISSLHKFKTFDPKLLNVIKCQELILWKFPVSLTAALSKKKELAFSFASKACKEGLSNNS